MPEPDSTQARVCSLFFSGPAGRIEGTLNKGGDAPTHAVLSL
jgi:hypothetical protein